MSTTTVNQTDCPDVKVPVPLFFTIGVVSLAENLLVVVSVILNRNLHSPMFCFICSLAAFNTMASLTKTWENLMIVFANVGQLEKKGSSEMKLDDVMDSLLCMCFVGSISSFLAIAVDRYITIFHALRYHNIMTMRRTKAILGVIWITCGVLAVLMIAALPSSSGGKFGRQRWRGSSMRGALTLTILFGAFVVCWTPFFLHLILIMVCPMNPYCECYRSLFELHVVLMMSHAAIDPAIYAFRSAELRHTFRKMLLCSDCKQRS
ncbi:adrenocorticotropic hormone receptor isoform X3 [Pseudochaenichthys georgianus]|uniref:adrenocorticotropic hormone receptor isoform X3 n=1 Tax=Pseudochaenichthys georgianus TaxID=52239 RepID=UPI00146B0A5B|nr:adrenocorticotropic hormone receptor isoform X2 [Pseudochaenichthys georgianus]